MKRKKLTTYDYLACKGKRQLSNLFVHSEEEAEAAEEAGIDFGIAYSTVILPLMHQRVDELRQVGHRALNTMLADMFRGVSQNLTPSAGIPMWSPDEALEELEFAVNEFMTACITT